MRRITYSILITMVALFSISCGTDPLDDVDPAETLRFTNAGDINDGIGENQDYSYTVMISNGVAIEANLTSFNSNGNWLSAEVSDNGSSIMLTGTAPNVDDDTEFGYQLTGIKSNEKNASQSFTIEVFDN